jgi:hypothetical protein
VGRRVPSRIDDGGSWRHGAAKARQRVRVVLCVQGEREPSSAVVESMASLLRGFSSV